MTHEPLEVDLELSVATAVAPSANVLRVAAMFGLGIDQQRTLAVVPPTRLLLRPGQVLFITGPSGSGKSSLLRLITGALRRRRGVSVIRFDALAPPPDRPLVDCFDPLPLQSVMRVLSLAGLNDAFVMLRRPSELSDGQRYRLRLAQTLARASTPASASDDEASPLFVVLADEFGATLDRVTAQVIARNVRKWTRRAGNVVFIAATTHDDLLEALEPDVLIVKDLGEGIEVLTRE